MCAGGVRWPAAGGRRRQVGARPRDECLAFYCVCMLDAADADSNLLFLLYAYALHCEFTQRDDTGERRTKCEGGQNRQVSD